MTEPAHPFGASDDGCSGLSRAAKVIGSVIFLAAVALLGWFALQLYLAALCKEWQWP